MKARVWKEGHLWLAVAPAYPGELFQSAYWQAAVNYANANAVPLIVLDCEPLRTPSPNVENTRRRWWRPW